MPALERTPEPRSTPRSRSLSGRDVCVELIAHVRREHDGPLRVVPELDLCQASARIDLATINARLCGWEIKTAGDRLTRLPRQQEVYGRVFDRVWLVADGRHLAAAETLIPPWWGILRLDGDVETGCGFTVVRRSKLNRDVDPASLVRLLWRAEVLEELAELGLASGLDRSPRVVLWQSLADAVPRRISRSALQRRVRRRLMAREAWRSGGQRTPGDGSS